MVERQLRAPGEDGRTELMWGRPRAPGGASAQARLPGGTVIRRIEWPVRAGEPPSQLLVGMTR